MAKRTGYLASVAMPLMSMSLLVPQVQAMPISMAPTAPAGIAENVIRVQDSAPAPQEGETPLIKPPRKPKAEGGSPEKAPAQEEQRPAAREAAPPREPAPQREPAPEAAPPREAAPAREPAREPAPPREPAPQREAAPEPAPKHAPPKPAAAEPPPAVERPARAPQEAAPAEAQQPQREQAREPAPAAEEAPRPRGPGAERPTAPAERPAEPSAEAPEAPKPNRRPPAGADMPGTGKPRPPAQAPAPSARPADEQPPAAPPAGEAPRAPEAPKDAARPQPAEPGTPARPRPPAPAAEEAAPKPEGSTPVPRPAPQPGTAVRPPVAPAAPGAPEAPAGPGTAPAPGTEPVPLPPGQAGQPGGAGSEQARPTPAVAPPVTPEEIERARRIAENPAASNQPVVLPVENGAAVLDSAKEAPAPLPPGGDPQRPDRRGPGERPRPVAAPDSPPPPPPKSDADAQAVMPGGARPPMRMEPVTAERGQVMRAPPRYEMPRGFEDRRQADDGRVIFQIDNRTFVRHDDSERFYEQGYQPRYEELRGGRVRQIIERDGGVKIVTIRDRYGNILQRSRIDRNGREDVLYYAPDLPEDRPGHDGWYDPGRDLPPMRLTVPVDQYIIDTSTEPDRDYYRFLEQPPVERVERVYSLDEVRYSARIRDKVRRIDLDTITFATGSADIPMNQAKTLRRVADAIQEILQRNPSETFLIEGHTDAVGSDESNLVLSDRRAESVANLLTDVYGIPPENLATQGYGERYLKVLTDGPSQENRRVTIRRITPLVKPVAQNR